MNFSRFKSILSTFPTEHLKTILGNNLVDMLIEWTPEDQSLFKKSTLADMIATIHGLSILKDKEFRKLFLGRLTENELLSFRTVMPKKHETTTDLNEIITYVSNRAWKEDGVIDHFLSILEIKENIFNNGNRDNCAMECVLAPERFYELLDYQFVVKQRILNELTSDVQLNKMLIQMPTGTGKTKTAMHTIIHHFNFSMKKKGLVIWLAHTTELLYQAYETFSAVWKHLGKGEIYAYKLWGDFSPPSSDVPLTGFLFCGFQKLIALSRNNPQLFGKLVQDCRLVVVDEAHKIAAVETKRLIDQFMTKTSDMVDRSLIGLTATPGRNIFDNTDINRLVGMFDSKLIGIEPDVLNRVNFSKFKARNANSNPDIIHYFQSRHILAKIQRERLTYPDSLDNCELEKIRVQATANGYDDYSKDFLETIGRNKSRNLSILNKLIRLNEEKMPTIVFACSVEHGSLLSTALTLKGIKNACVFGNMNSTMRQQAIQKFKDREDDLNILINYEVLTTGFDATNIQCVFITRPTQSVVLYSQMIGRGLRGPMMGGNETCILVDIEDNLKKYDESSAFNYFEGYWSYKEKINHNQEETL